MTDIKSVSIVIATYNPNVEVLKELLDSLLNQSHPICDIYIIDDHSFKPITYDDKRIKVIRLDRNHGPAHARNIALEYITSEYVAFTDSDCVVPNNWVRDLLSRFNESEYSGVTGPYDEYKSYHNIIKRLENNFFRSLQLQKETPYSYATTANWITKTNYIKECNGFEVYRSGLNDFNNYFNEDGELANKIIKKYSKKVLWSPSVTVSHNIDTRLTNIFYKQFMLVRGICLSNQRNQLNGGEGFILPTVDRKLIATIPIFILPLTIISNHFLYMALALMLISNITYYKKNLLILPFAMTFHIISCSTWILAGITSSIEVLTLKFICRKDSI